MTTLTMLACQIDIPPMTTAIERDAHVQRLASQIGGQLRNQQVDVVVLPELSTIDYSRSAFVNLHVLAEYTDGSSFDIWQQIALQHNCFVVYGFAEKLANGYTISTAVISNKGELVCVYHKLHLAQFGDSMEKEYFISGDPRLVVVEVNGFRLSPIICYDIRIPELCRTLAINQQTDVILHTGAYARDPSFYSWHSFAATRALENQVYFLSLNRAGEHFGHSVFCPPWIDENIHAVEFPEHTEEFRLITLTKDALAKARTDYTFIQDRLPSYDLPVYGNSEHCR